MNLRGLRSGARAGIRTWQRWLSTRTPTERVTPGWGKSGDLRPKRPGDPVGRATGTAATVTEQLPHEDPVFMSKLEARRRVATPELAKLRAYTLANRGEYDLATLSTLYAAAGMLKYASATLDRIYTDEDAARPTASQWIELLEAGRRDRDPLFAREMMGAMRQRAGRIPSKRMQLVLLNTYAESGMAAEAMRVYEEMAARHEADVSMAMALLKACIRQRDLPESFIDEVVDVVGRGDRPLPRRVMSMVLMVCADPQMFPARGNSRAHLRCALASLLHTRHMHQGRRTPWIDVSSWPSRWSRLDRCGRGTSWLFSGRAGRRATWSAAIWRLK